jgi:hypothetical protein
VEGEHVRLRAYTRRFATTVPAGTRSVELELPSYDSAGADAVLCNGRQYDLHRIDGFVRASIPIAGDTRGVEIRVVRRRAAPPAARRGVQPRAVLRRGTAEARDRLEPLVRRAGLAATLRRLEASYGGRMKARREASGPSSRGPA